MKKSRKAAALCALAATMAASSAQACWTGVERDAAMVANLNMMMMVTALRCRNGNDNFLPEYNRFVRNNNPVLGSQNAAVRNHFVRIGGSGGAEAAMDKFVIAIANSYGGGHKRMDCSQLKEVAGNLAQGKHSATSLLAIAEANVDDMPLVGGNCPISIASK
jgi:hypothetical protein